MLTLFGWWILGTVLVTNFVWSHSGDQRRLRTERISERARDVLEDDLEGRLKVFVYVLPSEYNNKLLGRDARCLIHMFPAEIFMHRFLLSSPIRTLSPNKADWFYTPVYTARDLADNGLPLHQYVIAKWPCWNQTDGAVHFFLVPHDFGACFHYKAIDRGILLILKQVTLVQTFGLQNHVCLNNGWIIIPPYAPTQKMQAHRIHEDMPRSIFVFFRGMFYDDYNDPEGSYYARLVCRARGC